MRLPKKAVCQLQLVSGEQLLDVLGLLLRVIHIQVPEAHKWRVAHAQVTQHAPPGAPGMLGEGRCRE